jgi:NADH-quinone oxidoreductase subunit G
MPVVTIDGRKVETGADATILAAARQAGIEIPTFCFHEALSVAANCRICLVEVKGSRKPLPACEVKVRDGMEVFTRSPVAEEARKAVLEFILLNHPVDCPVCDCAGECLLQDQYHHYSATPSRINVRKIHKPKATPIGPNVVFDGERCINCTRCVRFLREITGSQQLVQAWRGNHTEISLFEGRPLKDPYSLCTVDLCPVGALTSRDFRFKKRVWWLHFADSVCPECARGCRVRVDHADGRIWRVQPRFDAEVNRWWACDAGRLAFHRFESNRVLRPRLRALSGPEREADLDQAVDAAAAELSGVLASGKSVACIVNASASLEEALALFLFAREALGVQQAFLAPRADGPSDALLRVADSNANVTGIRLLAEKAGVKLLALDELFAAGSAPAAVVSVGSEYSLPRLPAGSVLESAVVLAVCQDEAALKSTVLFPMAGHYERGGLFVNCDGKAAQAMAAVRPPAGVTGAQVVLRRVAMKMGRPAGHANLRELTARCLSLLGITVAAGASGAPAAVGG